MLRLSSLLSHSKIASARQLARELQVCSLCNCTSVAASVARGFRTQMLSGTEASDPAHPRHLQCSNPSTTRFRRCDMEELLEVMETIPFVPVQLPVLVPFAIERLKSSLGGRCQELTCAIRNADTVADSASPKFSGGFGWSQARISL